MKITVFTSNDTRHLSLISSLSKVSDKLFVIQEKKIKKNNININLNADLYENYFANVKLAQEKIFSREINLSHQKNLKILSINFNSINSIKLNKISEYLESDLYIIFGTSYIKGDLVKFLINNKAINIHAGISPYYRGTDCNFWALYDHNPHLVGSTIHLLSEGLDNGPILYHSMPEIYSDHFEYTMSAVKSAFISLTKKIENKSLFKLEPVYQDKTKEKRFTMKKDFNNKIIKNYLENKVIIKKNMFDETLLIKPYFPNIN